MIIGRASAAEADYFEGDILGVKLFNQETPTATIQNAFTPETLAAHLPQAPSESRRTEDGRLCLSPCSVQGPLWAAAAAAAAARPTKPAVSLSCTDSLRRVEFNGCIGQKFLALCPPDCLHANAPLEGCKLFTSKSSICKAALHAGAVPKEGGEVLLTVSEGQPVYDASQGHFGGL
ncbi:Chromosome III, complete sequence, related [Eimeria praecox]|uniref:Chromosome III, complete sequence, related n=1 Tax=Eimeria praecox TaxID=51316 RepID=U6GZG4_9EIME|nr:Chromosome III, complete sequence, related [Eimeria praecox]